LVSPTRRHFSFNLKLNPRQTYFDHLTKWPGKGKAVEHAQQNVKTAVAAGTARPARPLAEWVFNYRYTLGDFAGELATGVRKTLESGQLGFAGAIPGRHMDEQIPPATHTCQQRTLFRCPML
jgi:hypothetical protein